MATNLQLDEKLINQALKAGNHQTKIAVVTEALKEYIQRRQQLKVLQLFGQVEYDSAYNYKTQRKRK